MSQNIFEIDVSGQDILDEGYTLVVAENKSSGLLLGFKMQNSVISQITYSWRAGTYRYANSKKGKTNLRVRLYCIIIYKIFCELRKVVVGRKILLEICRDFDGKEEQIKQNLLFFLGKLELEPEFVFAKLSKESIADKYAYLLSKDTQNKFKDLLVEIKPKEFEELLI